MPAPSDAAAAALAPDIATVTPDDDAFYPSSDGRPMAENMWQWRAIHNAAGDIEAVRPDALVAADILVYPQRGSRDHRIAPDVLVAFGLGTHNRSSYLVWKEGKPPDWVLEVASPSTASRDLDEKRRQYAGMGVPEYWLFDPQGDLFRRRGEAQLQGLKLVDGEYQAPDAVREGGTTMIRSEALGLDLRVEGELLRFRDAASGEDVRHRDEEVAFGARQARRRRAAEARVAKLEAALRRLQGGSGDDPP